MNSENKTEAEDFLDELNELAKQNELFIQGFKRGKTQMNFTLRIIGFDFKCKCENKSIHDKIRTANHLINIINTVVKRFGGIITYINVSDAEVRIDVIEEGKNNEQR